MNEPLEVVIALVLHNYMIVFFYPLFLLTLLLLGGNFILKSSFYIHV